MSSIEERFKQKPKILTFSVDEPSDLTYRRQLVTHIRQIESSKTSEGHTQD
jgi:hypothetical protein